MNKKQHKKDKPKPPKHKPYDYQPYSDLLFKKDVSDLKHQAQIEGLYK